MATSILDDPNCVVTAVPDEERGERLVLQYTNSAIPPDQLWAALSQSALPKLSIPKRGDIHVIDTTPVLGTGKLDLRQIRRLAEELSEPQRSPSARGAVSGTAGSVN